VSTRHSGIPELVHDGESGYLVRERDPLALARALTRLAGDAALRARMGAAGRRAVQRGYDLDALNDRLIDLLGSMGRRRAHPRVAARQASGAAR
jgi:colanic acid/amylovoran biosynthesis glycosyltransferase